MIPGNEIELDYLKNLEDSDEIEIPSYDFAMNLDNNQINGYVEDLEEVKQAIYLILGTQRWNHPIYPGYYGMEYDDLIGEDVEYVQAELTMRIPDALLVDERILNVDNFGFNESKHGVLIVTFDVETTKGTTTIETEVEI